ncbi:Rrf2 family transcriptional regulator [Pseudonocardia sp. EC080625-04]|uniref:RrF2 family transcriptional regulator n=1 Tax=Pseudonocardia sp. EC080625-04 TaxID=1096868 RepID=UPI0006CB3C02|nr:Rrf2 family transcriptional regulator [Pseudonocardia sp. EC080625-04]ALE71949.1 Rrf2 family transcriptional regulator [Pseudonocardia sp. EC080625-04]
MRMSQGVEWTLHVLLTLAWLGDDQPVSVGKLAAGHDLPAPYLNKQLQALAKAEILESVPGSRGGFRLARAASSITLMDVVAAIEGPQEAFRCAEIRQHGVGADLPRSAFGAPCAISISMCRAEMAWRRELASRTIADIRAEVDESAPDAQRLTRSAYDRQPAG